MSNVNEMANTQGGDLSELKKMFSDYQKKQNQSNKRKSREEILAKYFVPRKTKETFRILPPKPGRKYIEEAFFHEVPVNIAGGKIKHGVKIYCPAHNDPKVPKLDANGNPVKDASGNVVLVPAPCPLCEKNKRILSKQDPSIKGIKKDDMNDVQKAIKAKNDKIYKDANVWAARKFYIVRGIDKGAEKDGVKFWRFKHNYKNQGTLDKLLPILEDYMTNQQANFSDPYNGTDLSITMADAEFNGFVYKAVSAISARGKSQLSQDPIVAKQWLEDEITWRDVYPPKQINGVVTPHEYLMLIAEGNSPYWDDTDANNKHWVFPNHPELLEKVNTRSRNLDADDNDNFEQASDLDEDDEYPRVTINNITESKVGEYEDDASDMGKEVIHNNESQNIESDNSVDNEVPSEYDDLPF